MCPDPRKTSQPHSNQLRPDVPHHEQHEKGLAVCERCHAIWRHQRWALDEAEAQTLLAAGVAQVTCPGCVKVEREEYDGQVTIDGGFAREHQAEIMGLIKNTEAHIRAHNPIARVASVTMVEGDHMEVLTVSPFLAERIGKELHKAYKGDLAIKPTERQEFVRVSWHRDA